MVKRKEFVKERIISAVMRSFSRRGFFKVLVCHMAKEAGVFKGLVPQCFRNKQELAIKVARQNLPIENTEMGRSA